MAKIRFSNGTVVNFNGNPTPQDVEEVAAQMGRTVGYCVICGRFLTDAESVAKGIGPVCEKNTMNTYNQHRI
jgi:hypothetical protein